MRACAAAPGLVVAAITVGMLILGAAGRHPAWPHHPLSLAEAAALRDAGEVAHQLAGGADPNREFLVRAGVLDDRPRMMTPLTAAVEAKRAEIVSLLAARGVAPQPDEWIRLACLARERGDRDVDRELQRASGGRARCPHH